MIVLEGTDAVGKTSVINNLKDYNLLDRDKYISKLIDFNNSLIYRANKIKEYLDVINNIIIFLVNQDREELERRIKLRDIIDQFDRYTYLYNLLYLETYVYMEQNNMLNNKLYMVDCTGLNIDEQTQKVKKLIDSIKKDN